MDDAAGDRLTQLTADLVRRLPAWCERAKASAAYVSSGWVTGEHRTRRAIARGLERTEPRLFSLEDDPGAIDVGHLPPAAAVDLIAAAGRGELRLIQSIRVVESELVAVVDLSRSMLAGFFDLRTDAAQRADQVKLIALFAASASFLDVAASAGFRARMILSRDRVVDVRRVTTAKQHLEPILAVMRAQLLDGHRRAEAKQSGSEAFNLRLALQAVLEMRTRSFVVVVSDFLDPFSSYGEALTEVMRRHAVVLADVALASERRFPVPGWLNVQSTRVPLREGARHLERATIPQPIRRRQVIGWNREQDENYARLLSLARSGQATYDRLPGNVTNYLEIFQRCYARALQRVETLH